MPISKGKVFPVGPCKLIRGAEVQLHSFLILALGGVDNNPNAFRPGELEMVWMFWRRATSLVATGMRTPDCPARSLVAIPTTLLQEIYKKSKGVPRQAEVALGVPGRLRPPIFSTFGTTRVVGRQPYAPAAFTTGENPGTHFQRLSRPQGTWFCRKEPRKKSQVTQRGIDPGTVRPVAHRLNHYATPGLLQDIPVP